MNDVDPFASYRAILDSQLYSCIRFSMTCFPASFVDNTQPEISGAIRSSEKCSSMYDHGSSWINSFMIVMFVILGVLAVCTVILIIFVLVRPKKKDLKKQSKV